MIDLLTIEGIPPYDCKIEFDIIELVGSLTHRELHRVKNISGVRAGELLDALTSGDTDVQLALAVILLNRKGKRVDEEKLWNAPAASGLTITLDPARDDEEDLEGDDDDPPTEASASTSDEPRPNGGESTSPTSDSSQASSPSPTGLPD